MSNKGNEKKFKYVYCVAPIDFDDGTISAQLYFDNLINDLKHNSKEYLEYGLFNHVYEKMKELSDAVEFIKKYFEEHNEEFQNGKDAIFSIKIFGTPTDTQCELSYFAKALNNGTTYIFSNIWFPHLNKKYTANYVERFE